MVGKDYHKSPSRLDWTGPPHWQDALVVATVCKEESQPVWKFYQRDTFPSAGTGMAEGLILNFCDTAMQGENAPTLRTQVRSRQLQVWLPGVAQDVPANHSVPVNHKGLFKIGQHHLYVVPHAGS